VRPAIGGTAGTAEAGAAVKVKDGAAVLCTSPAAGDGSWSCTPGADLGTGPHTIIDTQPDLAGNVSPATGRVFTVDLTAPAAPLINFPLAGSYMQFARFSFNGTAEIDAAVSVQEGGATLCSTTASGGSWSCLPAADLSQGAHPISVTQTDVAGNGSPAATRSFTVDSLAPAAPVFSAPAAGSYITTTLRPVISGSGEAGAALTVKEGPATLCAASVGGDSRWSCSPTADLAQGLHSLRAFQADVAGNISAPATRSFTLDTLAPAAPIVATPAAGGITGALPEFSGGPGSAEAGAAIRVQVGGATLCTTTAAGDGSWSCTPAAGLSEGAHTASVTQTDQAGNVSPPAALSFTVLLGYRLFLAVVL